MHNNCFSQVKMALRTSGHLLLGVVRIYSRKAKYLLADCNEAFVKIKMAFRPGMVDLPEDTREAAVSAITLPEVFHFDETPMADFSDVDIQAQFTLNQSRAEEITMREDYNISLVTADDGFGDMGFEESSELMRATSGMEHNLMLTPAIDKEKEEATTSKMDESHLMPGRPNQSGLGLEAPIRDDGFGGNLNQEMNPSVLFEANLFDDTPMVEPPSFDTSGVQDDHQMHTDARPLLEDPTQQSADRPELPPIGGVSDLPPPDNASEDVKTEDSDDDGGDLDRFGGPPSVSPPSSENGSRPTSPAPAMPPPPPAATAPVAPDAPTSEPNDAPALPENPDATQDQTTLLQNEDESFALLPVDASTIKHGWPRTKRKRKLIVDEVKNISGEEMKAQLSDTTDIINTLDLAPPTKRLMHWKETGGVEKLFALPSRVISARMLGKMYQRHLISAPTQNEDFGMAGDKELENLSLEQVRDAEEADVTEKVAPRPRGRPAKRKQPEHVDSEEEEHIGPTRKSRHSEPDDHMDHLDDHVMSPPPASVAPLTPAPPAPEVAPQNETTEAPTNRPSTEESFNQVLAKYFLNMYFFLIIFFFFEFFSCSPLFPSISVIIAIRVLSFISISCH